jgi:hypothetical protein
MRKLATLVRSNPMFIVYAAIIRINAFEALRKKDKYKPKYNLTILLIYSKMELILNPETLNNIHFLCSK